MADQLHELFEAILETTVSERKMRLFAVACCRRLIQSELIDTAELIAETENKVLRVEAEHLAFLDHVEAHDRRTEWSRKDVMLTRAVLLSLSEGTYQAFDAAEYARAALGPLAEQLPEEAAQCLLFHEVFGPAVRFDPLWRALNDRAALRLADSIYSEQTWDDLPILGDALEDAGCDEPAILDHCRSAGHHVRGCWVVDHVLGRK